MGLLRQHTEAGPPSVRPLALFCVLVDPVRAEAVDDLGYRLLNQRFEVRDQAHQDEGVVRDRAELSVSDHPAKPVEREIDVVVLLGKAVVVTSVADAELRSIGVQRDHVRLEDSGNG